MSEGGAMRFGVAIGVALACAVTSAQTEFARVFVGGEEGYPVYRIPAALVAANGDVLAFAEARQQLSDTSANDIVMKRSGDNGRTWSAVQVVAADGENSLNNPCVITLRENGRILLMYQRYPAGLNERSVVPGIDGDKIVRVLLRHSDDHGATWSEPRDITRNAKPAARVTSVASGPGNAIQLRRGAFTGRVLFPLNRGPYGEWEVYAVFSDDLGETWSYGLEAGEGTPGRANEVQFVESTTGFVQLYARSFNAAKRRKSTFSIDAGLSWTAPTRDVPELVDPSCMGSVIRFGDPLDGEAPVLLYSGPNHESKRVNGTIWASRDDGQTWGASRGIAEGHFAYSHLVRTPDGQIGCLFETGEDGPYERIEFARVPADWIASTRE